MNTQANVYYTSDHPHGIIVVERRGARKFDAVEVLSGFAHKDYPATLLGTTNWSRLTKEPLPQAGEAWTDGSVTLKILDIIMPRGEPPSVHITEICNKSNCNSVKNKVLTPRANTTHTR